MATRNITVTVEEEVARWARVWAAKHDTSVSRIVGDLLRQRMIEEDGYDRAMKEYLTRKTLVLSDGRPRPKRDDLHERSGLR